jgi:hypothetical protein
MKVKESETLTAVRIQTALVRSPNFLHSVTCLILGNLRTLLLLILTPCHTIYVIVSYHIISYHISYHIISYHIITYHIISYHIISYIISYHIISYHIISYHIIYHIISYHIIYHIISYHINYVYIRHYPRVQLSLSRPLRLVVKSCSGELSASSPGQFNVCEIVPNIHGIFDLVD